MKSKNKKFQEGVIEKTIGIIDMNKRVLNKKNKKIFENYKKELLKLKEINKNLLKERNQMIDSIQEILLKEGLIFDEKDKIQSILNSIESKGGIRQDDKN